MLLLQQKNKGNVHIHSHYCLLVNYDNLEDIGVRTGKQVSFTIYD